MLHLAIDDWFDSDDATDVTANIEFVGKGLIDQQDFWKAEFLLQDLFLVGPVWIDGCFPVIYETSMHWLEWYDSLRKPSWTPAPATIGLIWQILYPIILISFGFVFVQATRKKVPRLVALPFAMNLIANLIFTPIQFGMRNLPLAALDILIVWVSIVWMMMAIWRYHRWIALAQVPYFVWVTLATVLQLSITASN